MHAIVLPCGVLDLARYKSNKWVHSLLVTSILFVKFKNHHVYQLRDVLISALKAIQYIEFWENPS